MGCRFLVISEKMAGDPHLQTTVFFAFVNGHGKELMHEDGLYRRFVGMRSQAIGWTLKGGKAHG